jgi:hypothetical protein
MTFSRFPCGLIIFYFIILGSTVAILGFSLQDVFGWHQNLGISDTRASELYQTNPNDPQIVRWANALQEMYETNSQVCFGSELFLSDEIRDACNVTIPVLEENCDTHPDSLVLCSDKRISAWIQKLDMESERASIGTIDPRYKDMYREDFVRFLKFLGFTLDSSQPPLTFSNGTITLLLPNQVTIPDFIVMRTQKFLENNGITQQEFFSKLRQLDIQNVTKN